MKVRKTFAFILMLIFALLAIPTFFIRSIIQTYLNPVFYEGPVIEESYDYTLDFLKKEISDDKTVKQYLDSEEIGELIQTYFPHEAVKEVVQDLVVQFQSLTDERSEDSITVNFAPLKANIEDMADDVARRIVSQIPECTTETIEDIEEITAGDELPPCIPKEIQPEQVKEPLKREIYRALNDDIPSTFKLEMIEQGSEEEMSLTEVVSVVQYVQLILPLFMLILLLLIMLILYKPFTLIMKYIGGAIALGGVFGLIGVQVLKQLFWQLGETNPSNFPNFQEFSMFLSGFVTDKMNVYSIYFLGIGAVIFIAGLYISHYYGHVGQDS